MAALPALLWPDSSWPVAARLAFADTIEWALVQAYQNNPSLNAQRASLRSTDENVPQALSGYRPKITATATAGSNYTNTLSHIISQSTFPNTTTFSNTADDFASRSVGITASQTLYNGNQTANKTRQAESQVMGARETLRVTEQQVLLDAATAYMDLLRDDATLALQRSNVEVLTEQLKQTRDRFNVGEVTRTDVAQAESRLAAGRSQLLAAQSQYVTSQAQYRRIIGVDPGKLAPGTPVDRLSPPTLPGAIAQGQAQSPSVLAAMYGVDVAELAVKVSEGALYPNLGVQATRAKGLGPCRHDQQADFGFGSRHPDDPALSRRRRVFGHPSGQGNARPAAADARRQPRSGARNRRAVAGAQLDAAKAQIEATTAQVNAAEIALNGVREEARVGQRTTLDVLNAQQELVNARVALVQAQHDRVVASYTLLAAVGTLSMQRLGLDVIIYDPMVHYQQIRDAWVGVRTPDGR